ncbi:hypothetical protein HDV05_002051, partial [Chytridiales sp. JEL 0842]
MSRNLVDNNPAAQFLPSRCPWSTTTNRRSFASSSRTATLYDKLQVSPTSSAKEIKAQFYKLSM